MEQSPETAAAPLAEPTRAPARKDREAALEVIALMAGGEKYVPALAEVGCSDRAFWGHLASDAALGDAYWMAACSRAFPIFEEAINAVSEMPRTVEVTDKDGEVVEVKIDPTWVAWLRLKVDTLKWAAARLMPKRFGEKIEHEVSGEVRVKPMLTMMLTGVLPPGHAVIDGSAMLVEESKDGGGGTVEP